MQTDTARRLIKETFERPFDKKLFTVFIKNLLNRIEEAPFTYRGNLIFDDFKDRVESLERIGKYTDQDDNKVDILVVHLKRSTSLDRARTAQRQFVAKYLKGSRGGELKDAALVAFVSPDEEDWRFSFVKMEYKIETTDKGRVRAKEEFTPAKRYSFLVGKNENSHTAQGQLLPILQDTDHNPTLKEIEDKFSVEKVTKEFFEKYRELFLEIKEALDNLVKKDKAIKADFESKGVETIDFAKKLLGQIVFLYFLQKKGWFGVAKNATWGTGPKNFLRLLFERKLSDYDNFFNDILEPLFYEALASEREAAYYSRFKCKVPFLNGGLFDPINNYDWVHTDILLPNTLFSNKEKTKLEDIGTGILDVFDRYNFTVKEDEPLEKEVAVDPEMLGKVFENLLEVKDRKSKGTYYTPREIVHYMCQESLINYMTTELEGIVNHGDIETLVRYGETAVDNDIRVLETGRETADYSFKLPDSIRDHADLIDQKLIDIKICDPAVGSGVFLVGMMTEIIRTRSVLTEFLSKSEERSAYNLKRHAIQNSLYGVDIDLGAVEIAKLRLWLSLIVDEENYRNIKPLPNLDFKIMQGNSLISEYMGIKFDDDGMNSLRERVSSLDKEIDKINKEILYNQSEFTRYLNLHGKQDKILLENANTLTNKKNILEKERDKFLNDLNNPQKEDNAIEKVIQAYQQKKNEFQNEPHKAKKDQLKLEIEDLMIQIFESKLKKQKAHYFRKLAAIEEKYSILPNKQKRDEIIAKEKLSLSKTEGFDLEKVESELRELSGKNKVKQFFLWKLNFADVFIEGGFDIAIANPPYITIGGKQDENRSSHSFEIMKATFGSFQYKTNYYVMFIERAIYLCRPNGIITYIVPRTLLDNYRMDKIRSIILTNSNIEILMEIKTKVFEEAETGGNLILTLCKLPTKLPSTKHNIRCVVIKSLLELSAPEYMQIPQEAFLNNSEYRFSLASDSASILVNTLDQNSVALGQICTIKNGVNTGNAAKILLAETKRGDKYRRILEGKDITRFRISWGGTWINYDPGLKSTIDLKKLETRQGRIDFSLRDEKIFIKPKIIVRQTADCLIAAYDDKGYITRHSTHLILPSVAEIDLMYVLALLNSKLLNWWYRIVVPEAGKVFAEVKIVNLEKLPIRIIQMREQKPFIDSVKRILECSDQESNHKIQIEMNKIDKMIYALYCLSEDNIKLVESYWADKDDKRDRN
jgi:hypothetical protein